MEPFVGLISLMALLALIYGPWQDTCTDYARQTIFEERDKIFDMARSGELDFNSPVYKEIRSSLELMIRFAHDVTVAKFIWIVLYVGKNYGQNSKSNLVARVEEIKDLNMQKKLRGGVLRSHIAIVGMVIAKSPVMWLLLALSIPVIIFAAVNGKLRSCLKSLINSVGDRVQQEAEEVVGSSHKLAA